MTPRVASATLHRLRSAPPFFARPSFELSFTLQSAVACCVRFRIHRRHRPPCGGEARRAPIIVFEHPRLEVGRGADVDRVIAAAKDVDTPHRRRSHRRQANSSPSTRFARSGHFSLTAACLSLTAACHERASGLPKARWRRVEMEAAGVEPEIRGLGNLLMARDFWREFVDTAALAAARGFHSRPHESSVFDLVFGEITEAAGAFWRRERCFAIPADRPTGFVPPPPSCASRRPGGESADATSRLRVLKLRPRDPRRPLTSAGCTASVGRD